MLYKLKSDKTYRDINPNNTVLEQLEIIFSFTSFSSVGVNEINILTQTVIVEAEEAEDQLISIFHLDLSQLGLLLMILENNLSSYRTPQHFAAICVIKGFDNRVKLDTSQILF
jgi:hypothetical protein